MKYIKKFESAQEEHEPFEEIEIYIAALTQSIEAAEQDDVERIIRIRDGLNQYQHDKKLSFHFCCIHHIKIRELAAKFAAICKEKGYIDILKNRIDPDVDKTKRTYLHDLKDYLKGKNN